MATLSQPTAQNLLTDTRMMLGQRDPRNSNWQDDELLSYLNEGARMYFAEAASANEGYFTTTTDLDIVANTEAINLPTDHFQTKNVWKKVTNGYIVLPYRNSMQDSYSTQGGTSPDSYLPSYEYRGNTLVLRPTPNFNETAGIKLEYIQFPDQMIYGGDAMTAQISPVFKQLIVMYAVCKAKIRESLVTGANVAQVAEANLSAIYTQFKMSIEKRSKNPTFVRTFNPEEF
jgi:hypothetical protein